MRFFLLIVMVTIYGTPLLAQTATLESPANGAMNIPVTTATIIVTLSHPVDTSSVLASVPVNDTVITDRGGVYLLEKSMFDTLANNMTAAKRAATYGSITANVDTLTMAIADYALKHNTEYVVFVSGIRVIDTTVVPSDTRDTLESCGWW